MGPRINTNDEWLVEAVIEPKPSLRDPEGETILKALVHREGWGEILEIRSARLLRFKVKAISPEEAERLVKKVCDDLRLYNPVSSTLKVRAYEGSRG
jgi:phosphoribosylformylglycinamidine synthase